MGPRHAFLALIAVALRAAAAPPGAPWAWPRGEASRGVPRRHGTPQELEKEAEKVGAATQDQERTDIASSLKKWQKEEAQRKNATAKHAQKEAQRRNATVQHARDRAGRAAAHEERDSKKLEADITSGRPADAGLPPAPAPARRAYMEPSIGLPKAAPKAVPANSTAAVAKEAAVDGPASSTSAEAKGVIATSVEAMPSAAPIETPVLASTPGRLIFLFMAGKSMMNQPIWMEFFKGAPKEHYASFIHFSDTTKNVGVALRAAIPGIQQVHTVPTYYCHDLVTAMVHLVQSSILADPIGHPNDKFIFVSESTLPLKPFHQVRQTLLSDVGSDLCIFPKDHWGTVELSSSGVPESRVLRGKDSSGTGTTAYLVKHHQWVILNREHAQKMARIWTPVDGKGHWEVPLFTKGGRLVSVNAFHRTSEANYCTDEWAFFATLFGAVPVSDGEDSVPIPGLANGQGPKGVTAPLAMSGNLTKDVQGKCYTYAFFESAGPSFTKMAKKIAATTKEGTKLTCSPSDDGCWQHPMEMKAVSESALHVLRKSDFLFARKFANRFSVIGTDYASVIFRNRSDYA